MLNLLESKYYFDHLRFVSLNDKTSYLQKLQQCNITFLSLINALTEQKEKQIFTGWFAKINFICQTYNLGNDQEEELQALRRLLKRSQVSRGFTPSKGQFLIALKVLSELIERFSDESIPDRNLCIISRQESFPD